MRANPERDIVYEKLARVGHALANPRRLRLLSLLGHAERTVEELAAATGQSHAATSGQLQVLRRARLVQVRHEGRHARYRINGPEAQQLATALHDLGAALVPEVREVIRGLEEEPGALSGVDARELLARVDRGEVTLLDLRPPEEFAAGHLPGARSLPFDDIGSHLDGLSEGEIVAYCRGPWCLMAREGVRRMREAGLDARRLGVNVPNWRAHGLPLEVS